MARVFLYERTGKVDAAIRDLRSMLAERPGDAVVQNALGYMLADHDRQLDEAQQLLTAALAQTPDSAAVLDSMGWVLHRQGTAAGGARLPAAFAASSATTRRSTCTSARCSGPWATRRRPARPGSRRSRSIPTTRCCRSGSSGQVPDAVGRAGWCCRRCWRLRRHAARRASSPARRWIPARVVDWTARGRMAIALASEGGSGTFDWEQHATTTSLQVRGPLGAGALRIVDRRRSGAPSPTRRVARSTARRPQAPDPVAPRRGPAARPRCATGCSGSPAPGSAAQVSRGRAGAGCASIEQAGWTIGYDPFTAVQGWSVPDALDGGQRRRAAQGHRGRLAGARCGWPRRGAVSDARRVRSAGRSPGLHPAS